MVAVKSDARSTEYIDASLRASSNEKVLRGRGPSWQDLSWTSYGGTGGFRIQLSLLTLTSY